MTDSTSATTSTPSPEEIRQQDADKLKYQAKLEVVREVVARRGAMTTDEAKQLAECVNAAFDDITL